MSPRTNGKQLCQLLLLNQWSGDMWLSLPGNGILGEDGLHIRAVQQEGRRAQGSNLRRQNGLRQQHAQKRPTWRGRNDTMCRLT